MAIAKVESVTNSCFIDGGPASVGQEINYGTVIETYNIDIGLEESFLSKLIVDSGYLSLSWVKGGESSSIKSFCKVIYQSSGKSPGPNTVLLDPKSIFVTARKPNVHFSHLQQWRGSEKIAVITKKSGTSTLNEHPFKVGTGLFYGDIIIVGPGDSSVLLIFLDNKSVFKMRSGVEYLFRKPRPLFSGGMTMQEEINKILGRVSAEVPIKGKRDFVITYPTSVAGVKG